MKHEKLKLHPSIAGLLVGTHGSVFKYRGSVSPDLALFHCDGTWIQLVPYAREVAKPNGMSIISVTVTISKGNVVPLRRLIAETWIPNKRGLKHVVHKDGDAGNCDVENLRWSANTMGVGRRATKSRPVVLQDTEDGKLYYLACPGTWGKQNGIPQLSMWICKARREKRCTRGFRVLEAGPESASLPEPLPLQFARRVRVTSPDIQPALELA